MASDLLIQDDASPAGTGNSNTAPNATDDALRALVRILARQAARETVTHLTNLTTSASSASILRSGSASSTGKEEDNQ